MRVRLCRLPLLLIVGLMGCGTSTPDPTDDSSTPSAEASESPPAKTASAPSKRAKRKSKTAQSPTVAQAPTVESGTPGTNPAESSPPDANGEQPTNPMSADPARVPSETNPAETKPAPKKPAANNPENPAPEPIVASNEVLELDLEQASSTDLDDVAGKTLEATGAIQSFSISGDGAVVTLSAGHLNGFQCILAKEEIEPWARLAPPQVITLRGTFDAKVKTVQKWRWRIIDPGPNTVPIIDATVLANTVEKDPVAASADYSRQYLILTGTLLSLKFNTVGAASFEIAGNSTCQIQCTASPAAKPALQKLKPGDTIQIFGQCADINASESPAVVMLPVVLPITVALPVQGVTYPQEIETLKSRLSRQADAMRESKPDASVTAVALIEEHLADAKAAHAKYYGKILEVSGNVLKLSESTDTTLDVVHLDTGKMDLGSELACQMTQANPWNSLAPGQSVVLRGLLIRGAFGPQLSASIVVKVDGGEKPPELTADKLAAEFAKDPKTFHSKRFGKWFVVTGTLAEIGSLSVNLTAGKELMVQADFSTSSSGRHWSRFSKHQPGDKVKILGRVEGSEPGSKTIKLADCWERE